MLLPHTAKMPLTLTYLIFIYHLDLQTSSEKFSLTSCSLPWQDQASLIPGISQVASMAQRTRSFEQCPSSPLTANSIRTEQGPCFFYFPCIITPCVNPNKYCPNEFQPGLVNRKKNYIKNKYKLTTP